MKRIRLISFLCLILLSGCGTKTETTPSSTIGAKELTEKILSTAGTLPDMSYYSSSDEDASDWFEYLCDFDYGKVKDFYISYATEGTSEELFVIQLNDSADADSAASSLQRRIETRIQTFDMYMPDEVSKLNRAIVLTSGNYVVLLSCPDISNAKTTFDSLLA